KKAIGNFLRIPESLLGRQTYIHHNVNLIPGVFPYLPYFSSGNGCRVERVKLCLHQELRDPIAIFHLRTCSLSISWQTWNGSAVNASMGRSFDGCNRLDAEGLISVNLNAVSINENGKNEYEWQRDKRQERPDLNLHCGDESLGLLPTLLFVLCDWSLGGVEPRTRSALSKKLPVFPLDPNLALQNGLLCHDNR
ncbi:hypothetical protein DPX16_6615, partial [Anabarilius grahami]